MKKGILSIVRIPTDVTIALIKNTKAYEVNYSYFTDKQILIYSKRT